MLLKMSRDVSVYSQREQDVILNKLLSICVGEGDSLNLTLLYKVTHTGKGGIS